MITADEIDLTCYEDITHFDTARVTCPFCGKTFTIVLEEGNEVVLTIVKMQEKDQLVKNWESAIHYFETDLDRQLDRLRDTAKYDTPLGTRLAIMSYTLGETQHRLDHHCRILRLFLKGENQRRNKK